MKEGRKSPMMKQKLKQCRKMKPSSHKNQSTKKWPLMKKKMKQCSKLNLDTVWPRFFTV